MKKIVFATNNNHKLEEVRALLETHFEVVSLSELGCFDDIAETADTLEGNALIKAKYIADTFGVDCFADDTGLEIEYLNGAPGVYSARYAGENHDANANMNKVLTQMALATNRQACFRTIITMIENGKPKNFEGLVRGQITTSPAGTNGFGYDPIFIPEGFSKTFAQLDAATKNKISHRGQAVKKLVEYLKTNYSNQ